ncbi:MAG: hypothetical protein ABI895_08780 [Deltaproteobacteria bacterium]
MTQPTPKAAHPSPLGESDPATAGLARRLRHGSDGSVVVLEAGDPLWTPEADAVDWDRDADAVSAEHPCAYCGSASEPLFKLEDGAIACGSCLHGSRASI